MNSVYGMKFPDFSENSEMLVALKKTTTMVLVVSRGLLVINHRTIKTPALISIWVFLSLLRKELLEKNNVAY